MSDVINEDERHEAATEEPINGAAGVRALPVKLPGGFDGTEPGKRGAYKHGLLANGVQMIRYASGPTVTLVGKRERGPCERHDGRTDNVIYKVTVSRETHSAEVIADGAALCTVFVKSSSRLEHYGLALLNSWLKFNARRKRHEKDRINRRKEERAGTPASPRQEVAK